MRCKTSGNDPQARRVIGERFPIRADVALIIIIIHDEIGFIYFCFWLTEKKNSFVREKKVWSGDRGKRDEDARWLCNPLQLVPFIGSELCTGSELCRRAWGPSKPSGRDGGLPLAFPTLRFLDRQSGTGYLSYGSRVRPLLLHEPYTKITNP